MKLQFALDLPSTPAALSLLTKVAPYADIIELGTPLIKIEGLSVISAVKAAHPDHEIFADLKTMDAGKLEAQVAFDAGADYVAVLALANDATISGAVEAGKEAGKKVVADLIGVPADQRLERIEQLSKLGVAHVEVHAGLDEQAQPGYSIETLLDTVKGSSLPFAVAGGVKSDSIGTVKDAGATIAVVGGGVYNADDPEAAAKSLREAIS